MKGIYGRELSVNCMKFVGSRDLVDTQYGKLYTFSVEHDEVKLIASTPYEERPREFFGNTNIEFEEGTYISGKKLWGCSNERPGRIRKGGSGDRSGRHSRQTVKIKGEICYAVIISDWSNESIEIHPLDYNSPKELED